MSLVGSEYRNGCWRMLSVMYSNISQYPTLVECRLKFMNYYVAATIFRLHFNMS